MIRRIDPDEAVTINGVQVTGRALAEARQELSHRGVHNPRWSELSEHDQETAAISAGGWLRALTDLVPTIEHVTEITDAEDPDGIGLATAEWRCTCGAGSPHPIAPPTAERRVREHLADVASAPNVIKDGA